MKFKTLLASAAIVAFSTLGAQAANFSFTGNFTSDDDVQFFNFSVGAVSTVTFQSFQYGGGTQADGNIVSQGGFDSILSVFDSLGDLIADNDDGGSNVNTDSNTGEAYDTFLELGLAAGSYSVAVTQFNNFSNGSIGTGFFRDGEGNFTAALGSCTNAIFCDVSGVDPHNNRTDNWAFDILDVGEAVVVPSPVPLPAGLPLMLIGFGALGLIRRKT